MIPDADHLSPESYLERFGLSEFRPGQRDVVEAVLAGKDVLCIMPTGGGKSLCFQLPSLARDGLTLVVSPLIALMKDQVDVLQRKGALAGLHFELGRDEEAVRHARRSVDLQPSDRSSYRPVLAAALAHLGRSEEAMQQVQIVRALYPDWNLRLVREMASARFVERLVEGFRIGGWDLRDRLDS